MENMGMMDLASPGVMKTTEMNARGCFRGSDALDVRSLLLSYTLPVTAAR
nr:ORF7 [Apple luteovirus 1]